MERAGDRKETPCLRRPPSFAVVARICYSAHAMREDAPTPEAELLVCDCCAAPYDPEDNFCRRCGFPLHQAAGLPAVRDGRYEAVVWQPAVPAVVKGAAVLAAGTLAELLVRRILSSAFRPRSLLPSRTNSARRAAQVVEREEPVTDDTQMVSETLVLRRVRFRR